MKAKSVASEARVDGWSNVLSGLGTRRDPSDFLSFRGAVSLSNQPQLLDELYSQDDLCGRIVDQVAEDMFREWVDLRVRSEEPTELDVASQILQLLEELSAQSVFIEAQAWARLYGGSVVIVGVNDGLPMSEPVNEQAIESIDYLVPLDRNELTIAKRYGSENGRLYGAPEIYRINTSQSLKIDLGGFSGQSMVHESRTLMFRGAPTTERRRRFNGGWDDSVLERVLPKVSKFQASTTGIFHLLQTFSQGVYQIAGLSKMLASGQEDLVRSRLSALDVTRSVFRAVILDREESFEQRGVAATGMSELYDRGMMAVSAASQIPVTILFGRSPAGMNATGESDLEAYNARVRSLQNRFGRKPLERLIRLLFLTRTGPTNGIEPQSWAMTFNELELMNEAEQAEARLSVARADDVYLSHGVVSAEEVAASRFGGEMYSPDTSLTADERPADERVDAAPSALLAISRTLKSRALARRFAKVRR